ncbi:MAG: rhamnogalacturonan lyase [Halanaerobiaceae bacterium]
MEYDIDRGLVAFSVDDGVYLQWRLLGTEETDTPFNVYRDGEKVNEEPLTESTNYLDKEGSKDDQYKVEKVVENGENEKSDAVEVWEENYLSIPLDTPEDGEVKGEEYHYIANDASTADLDGDGQYEIILKWEPSNAKDNSQSGHTGNVLLDAYKLDGTRLWRIDLGRNIRAGAHYTQFLAYDFDGNGQAEVAFKTADGTEDSAGNVIGDPDADWRNDNGYILEGPEYLTIFDGESGEEMETIDYHPPRGNVRNWGDDYGNRVDRFLAGVAYLDGKHPSLVMARGYYTRTVLAAYNWRDGELTEEWIFDTNDSGKGEYTGQGSHSLSVADVDFDSKDEIVYGALVVDDDGSALHSTGIGHGDALHVSNFYPDRFGLEIYDLAESSEAPYGAYMRDAETGEILWGVHAGSDVGRGVAANISDETPGAEAWASSGIGLRDRHGEQITNNTPSINFAIWWDGDLIRELLDGRRIDKWNPEEESSEILFNGEEISSINGTKANPNLQADILGDWREEAIWRTSDNSELRIFVTPHQTEHRIHTLMHDRQYRLAIAWQNVAYNQPPHPSFYLGPEEDVPQYNPGLAHKALERFDEEKDSEE